MADQTSILLSNLISASQGQKEVTANELFDMASPVMLFGRNALTVTGLTWGYMGGRVYIDGVATAIASGTVAMTASQTNYVEVSIAGAVTSNTAGFSADKSPLYVVTTSASAITNYVDHRNPMTFLRLFYGRVAIAMADANKTLTHAQATCESIECTGALTALRDLIVPTVKRRYVVYANNTGGFGVRVKTSAGTGITVADGNRAILECDGTNVVSIGAGFYTLPAATSSVLGGVKEGAGVSIAGDGTISATGSAPSSATLTDFANAVGTTTGLTYGYNAGTIRNDNATTLVAAGTIALTASTTNYVEVDGGGTVSKNTIGFTAGRFPMATVLTGGSTITTITDKRGIAAVTVAGGFVGGTMTSAINEAPTVTVASSTTPAIFAAASNSITLSGSATVTGFDTIADGAYRWVTYSGAVPLTYNATSMILIGAASRVNAVGDVSLFKSIGSGNTREMAYIRANGIPVAGIREVLTAARTYYVRSDGNDSNNGLANTSGGAFLTIQRAVDVACGLIDANIYQVTIQIQDGTWTTGLSMITPMTGNLPLIVQGNNGTPDNVHLNLTGTAIAAANSATLRVVDMKITATVIAISSTYNSTIEFGNITFGATGARHLNAAYGGALNAVGDYRITAGGPTHFEAATCGLIRIVSRTITLTGTPNFTVAFAQFLSCASGAVSGNTWSGAATGKRYNCTLNGVLDTLGATLPGSIAGTTATGGQYT